MSNMSTIQTMKERHSVRKYEKEAIMTDTDLQSILEATLTAPSSWNLQHWKFLVVKSDEQKQKLLPIAYNQQQIVDSNVTIAVLGDLEANKNFDPVYSKAVANGYMTEEVKSIIKGQVEKAYQNPQVARDEAILNSSLAAMQLMLAAKAKGYDSVPMGGFNKAAFIEEFKVPARFLPVMLISVGKAAAEPHASYRLPLEDLVQYDTF